MPCPTVHFSPLYFLNFLDFFLAQSTNPRRGYPVFPLYISLGIRLIVIGLNYLIFFFRRLCPAHHGGCAFSPCIFPMIFSLFWARRTNPVDC